MIAHRPSAETAQRRVLPVLLSIALSSVTLPASAQQETEGVATAVEGTDYRVYDASGRVSSLDAITEFASRSEVLLVGEEHDDTPGHAFEAVLLDAALSYRAGPDAASERPVVLSLEMFERDVQYVLDEYLDGLISEAHFLLSSRPWDDYEERYRPLVESAKSRGAPVVAANAPRRYVNRVTRDGPESLESLSDVAKGHLPPLPYPAPSERYRAEWDALMAAAMEEMEAQEGEASPGDGEAAPSEESPSDSTTVARDYSTNANAIYSQALWDASMGHAITTALVEHLGALVIHFAGSFHVANRTGIAERIEDYRPGTRVTTVVITKVEDIDVWSAEDHADLADFVVLTPKPAESVDEGGS